MIYGYYEALNTTLYQNIIEIHALSIHLFSIWFLLSDLATLNMPTNLRFFFIFRFCFDIFKVAKPGIVSLIFDVRWLSNCHVSTVWVTVVVTWVKYESSLWVSSRDLEWRSYKKRIWPSIGGRIFSELDFFAMRLI